MADPAAFAALQGEVEELRGELERAYDTIDELEAGTGQAETRARLTAAEERMHTLEADNARLSRGNDAAKDSEESLLNQVQALQKALNENKEQRDEAVRVQSMLKGQLDKVTAQLAQCVCC